MLPQYLRRVSGHDEEKRKSKCLRHLIACTCQLWQVNTHPHTPWFINEISKLWKMCAYEESAFHYTAWFVDKSICCDDSVPVTVATPIVQPQIKDSLSFLASGPFSFFENFAPNFVAPALLAICFLNVAIVAQLLSEFIANLMSGNSMAYFRIFISFRVDHSEKFSCESNRMVANVQWDRQIWWMCRIASAGSRCVQWTHSLRAIWLLCHTISPNPSQSHHHHHNI